MCSHRISSSIISNSDSFFLLYNTVRQDKCVNRRGTSQLQYRGSQIDVGPLGDDAANNTHNERHQIEEDAWCCGHLEATLSDVQ